MLLTVHMSPVEMELLPLLCLCLLSVSGTTFADGNNPEVVKVKEGNDVILPCSTKGSVSSQRIEWKTEDKKTVFLYEGTVLTEQDQQFIDRVSLFDGELKNGNASIKIKNTKVSDSGIYTCEFPHLKQIFHVKLLVGAVSKPSITTLGKTSEVSHQQCEVVMTSSGFKLKISWQDSSGNVLTEKEIQKTESGGSYNLSYTVTKSGTYSCVATMEEIRHRVSAETYVTVFTPKDTTTEDKSGMSTGAIIGIVVGVLCFLIVLGVGVKKCCTDGPY